MNFHCTKIRHTLVTWTADTKPAGACEHHIDECGSGHLCYLFFHLLYTSAAACRLYVRDGVYLTVYFFVVMPGTYHTAAPEDQCCVSVRAVVGLLRASGGGINHIPPRKLIPLFLRSSRRTLYKLFSVISKCVLDSGNAVLPGASSVAVVETI